MECQKWLAVKKQWIEKPIVGDETKMFYSKNDEKCADFSKEIRYYLNKEDDGVYNCFVYRQFGKLFPIFTY